MSVVERRGCCPRIVHRSNPRHSKSSAFIRRHQTSLNQGPNSTNGPMYSPRTPSWNTAYRQTYPDRPLIRPSIRFVGLVATFIDRRPLSSSTFIVHLRRHVSTNINDNDQPQPSTTTMNNNHRPTIHRLVIGSPTTTIRSSIDSNSTRTGYGWNSEGESGSAFVFRLLQNTRSTERVPDAHDASNPLHARALAFTYLNRTFRAF
jgi:hypothetical protein